MAHRVRYVCKRLEVAVVVLVRDNTPKRPFIQLNCVTN